jgi:hypothetical protein
VATTHKKIRKLPTKPKRPLPGINAVPTITGSGTTITVTYTKDLVGDVGPEFTITGGLILDSASNPAPNIWVFTFSGNIAGNTFTLNGNDEYVRTKQGGTADGGSKTF